MVQSDRYGLELTTSSEEAASSYRQGIDLVLARDVGAENALLQAVEADDSFALAHLALGFVLASQGQARRAGSELRSAAATARRTTSREHGHVRALLAALSGRGDADRLADTHLAEHPLDALVLYARLILVPIGSDKGLPDAKLSACEGVASAYGDDWWFLGAFSYAQQEAGAYDLAQQMAERSLASFPRNGGAVHSLAHIDHARGRHAEGLRSLSGWLDESPREAPCASHLGWHLALFHLELGLAAGVLAAYERFFGPRVSSSPSGLFDGASILWRLELGGDSDDVRWDELRELAQRRPLGRNPASCLAAALAFAGAGDITALHELSKRVAASQPPSGPSIVLQLVEGLAAFAKADWAESVRLLEPSVRSLPGLGASAAQVAAFQDTLLVAYFRSGEHEAARAELRRRLRLRPSPRDSAWLTRVVAPRSL